MVHMYDDDVRKLAHLARIRIDETTIDKIAQQLGDILEYDSRLREVDTSQIATTAQVTGLKTIYREDEVVTSDCDRNALLKNAPQTQDGYIKVKRVL